MRKLALGIGLVAMFAAPAWAAVKGEEVQYRDGDVVMKGYLAYDDAVKGKRPGVVVAEPVGLPVGRRESVGLERHHVRKRTPGGIRMRLTALQAQ